jgi:PAS domain-containing protein
MFYFDLPTLLVIAGLSFVTASCAVGGLLWATGRTQILPMLARNPKMPGLDVAVQVSEPAREFDRTELTTLRAALAHTPSLIWQRDADGTMCWANAAYMALVKRLDPDAARAWPLPDLFIDFMPRGLPGTPTHRRASLEIEECARLWFQLDASDAGASALCSATPIDATIIAEEKTRRFMQTLTQTFAHIRTGLAIFDRDRRLTMFNPALMDLTGLEAEWLASRPTLNSFFDQLRNRNTLPEPKDYKSWRDRLDWIEEEANNGQFDEVWSLPDGQVFRVCARPHPDGGLAFLIEDISDEMALTRRFRAELELSQSVINAMDEAVVVFSPAGTQLMANEAYTTLWDVDEAGPDAPITAPTILDANKLWQTRAKPAPLWGEIREFVSALTQRAEWSDTGHLVDGIGLACRVVPLTGGATLVSFTEAEPIAVFVPRHRTEARAN